MDAQEVTADQTGSNILVLAKRDVDEVHKFKAKVLEIIQKARPEPGWQNDDRDCYFLAKGQENACDEIANAIEEIK